MSNPDEDRKRDEEDERRWEDEGGAPRPNGNMCIAAYLFGAFFVVLTILVWMR